MTAALLVSLAALLLAASGCGSSSVPSFIPPFTDCVRSRGKDGFYRGAIDVTESGARCMNWSAVAGFGERYPGQGVGEHNYCRNPDGRIRPWCFFRSHRGRVDWGYCDCKQGKQAWAFTAFPRSAEYEGKYHGKTLKMKRKILYLFQKAKSKILIERNIENESCSTT